MEISPGIERAWESATAQAQERGEATLRISDWLAALLHDEEGRPYELLLAITADVARLRSDLLARTLVLPPAPHRDRLFSHARDCSIRLRGEPGLTTDLVLLALLTIDPSSEYLANYGVHPRRIEQKLRSPMMADAEPESPPMPEATFQVSDSTDSIDVARIVDVNANRAREGLRVLEDYARFVRQDVLLTTLVKQMRHGLAELCQQLPSALLTARNTPGDVGTSITGSGEYERQSTRQVAIVNCKRLQESLRSLEEYGKIFGTHVGRECERLRYESYTLERALLHDSVLKQRLQHARLYFLATGSQCQAALDWTIAEAAAGGVDVVQLREKQMSDRELLARAKEVRQWTRKANVLFIMNDRVDLARLAEADGVHLGQDDMPVHEARRILGPDALIGVSTHNLADVRRAVLDGADYIGVGPTFPSSTKAFDKLAGLEFVRAATAETAIPAFALGGIGPKTIGAVVAAGARRVAVSAAIAEADDPRQVARILRDAVEQS